MALRSTRKLDPTGVRPLRRWKANAYLTDGVHLLRTTSAPIVQGDQCLVPVEDCRTLDVVLMAERELSAMALRRVRPAPGPDPNASGAHTRRDMEAPPLWE
jgi:hypothetical protein